MQITAAHIQYGTSDTYEAKTNTQTRPDMYTYFQLSVCLRGVCLEQVQP